jgi:hypothetical protein
VKAKFDKIFWLYFLAFIWLYLSRTYTFVSIWICSHPWESLKTTLTHYIWYQNACYNNMDQYTLHKVTIAKGRVNKLNLVTCTLQTYIVTWNVLPNTTCNVFITLNVIEDIKWQMGLTHEDVINMFTVMTKTCYVSILSFARLE